jgi:glycosyltransferase involved in cell wall biosynthesis
MISVVIATHNRPKLLRRAIHSVEQQSYTDWELLVMGDGATAETTALMTEYDDPRIRYHNGPRQKYPTDPEAKWLCGGTEAFNRGLELAQGEWVTGLGDDDEIPHDALAILLSRTASGADFVYGRAEVVGGGVFGEYPPELGKITAAMWRRNSHRADPECWKRRVPSDWDLWSRMMPGLRIAFVPQIVYRYYPNAHVPKTEPLIVAVIPTRFHPPELTALRRTLEADGVPVILLESEQYEHRIYRMWNEGVRLARADHPGCTVAVLNDDISIDSGSIPTMARLLREHPEIGVIYPEWNGTPHEPRLVPTTGMHHSGGMTGFCFLFAADLPAFDESYQWWYGDDAFEEAVRASGLQVCRAEGVPIRHNLNGSAERVWGELEPLTAVDRTLWTQRHEATA